MFARSLLAAVLLSSLFAVAARAGADPKDTPTPAVTPAAAADRTTAV
jgi:hypothetical protein